MSQNEPSPQTFTLPRTSLPPLQFTGRQLAAVDEELKPFKRAIDTSRRWHTLHLYRTESGKFVLSVGFRTKFEGEVDRDTVFVCPDEDGVRNVLMGDGEGTYDPLEFIEGFPDDPKYEERQRKMENRILDEFDSRVTRLLGAAGFVEKLD